MNWLEKLKELRITVAGQTTASLLKQSVYQLVYEPEAQHCVGLGLPPNAGNMPKVWLSPLYDQVTTTLYTYERPGGIETIDHTMALKLRRGRAAATSRRRAAIPCAMSWKNLAATCAACKTRQPSSST